MQNSRSERPFSSTWNSENAYYKPADLVRWALNNGLNLPNQLLAVLKVKEIKPEELKLWGRVKGMTSQDLLAWMNNDPDDEPQATSSGRRCLGS